MIFKQYHIYSAKRRAAIMATANALEVFLNSPQGRSYVQRIGRASQTLSFNIMGDYRVALRGSGLELSKREAQKGELTNPLVGAIFYHHGDSAPPPIVEWIKQEVDASCP